MDDGRKRAINPKEVAPPLKGHYSNSVKVTAGPLLFIAGQISIEAQGRLVGAGDLRAQATQVLENIRAILRANGAEMEDVVSVTVYVTDISAFHNIADIRLQYFPKDGPASAMLIRHRLHVPMGGAP